MKKTVMILSLLFTSLFALNGCSLSETSDFEGRFDEAGTSKPTETAGLSAAGNTTYKIQSTRETAVPVSQ